MENNLQISEDIKKQIFQKALTITKRHCLICKCRDDAIDVFIKKILVFMNEDKEFKAKAKARGFDEWTWDNCVKSSVKDKAIEQYVKTLTPESCRCHREIDLINDIITIYGKKYPLDDPEVYLIVSSLIELRLTAHRMQLESNYSGVLQEIETKSGNIFYKINPVERIKKEYHEAVINAVAVLNKIIVGEKHLNVNTNIDIDWTEVMKHVEDKKI